MRLAWDLIPIDAVRLSKTAWSRRFSLAPSRKKEHDVFSRLAQRSTRGGVYHRMSTHVDLAPETVVENPWGVRVASREDAISKTLHQLNEVVS